MGTHSWNEPKIETVCDLSKRVSKVETILTINIEQKLGIKNIVISKLNCNKFLDKNNLNNYNSYLRFIVVSRVLSVVICIYDQNSTTSLYIYYILYKSDRN